jgi:hypothetical protein
MSQLFQQSNFKTEEKKINGTTFILTELSAAAQLNYTEYAAECAVEMKAANDQLPADHKDWTDTHINTANKSLIVFRVRVRVRLVALALQPYFKSTGHSLASSKLEEVEEVLLNELKGPQLLQLENIAKKLTDDLEDGTPKPAPGETSASN